MPRKIFVGICLWLLAFTSGCLLAPPPAPPGVLAQGAVISMPDPQSVNLRACGSAVTLTFDNQSNKSVLEKTVILSNVRSEAVSVTGAMPVERQNLSPTTVKFLFRLPPSQKTTLFFSTPTGDAFSFAVIGDNRDGRKIYLRLIDRLNAANPAFIVNGGDLVPSGKPSEYAEFTSDSTALSVPLFTVLGNHDIKDDGRSLYNRLLAPNYYDFTWGNSQFVMLDDADGNLDDTQLKWLENKLQNRRSQNLFLFMHRPPFDPRPNQQHAVNRTDLGNKLVDLAAKYHVTAVFASHIHMYWQGERQGIPYYITGGAGAPLYAAKAAGGIYHYILVTVSGDSVVAKPVDISTK